jgi:hypothetical protein
MCLIFITIYLWRGTVLGFALRASYVRGRPTTTRAKSPALCAFGSLSRVLLLCPGWSGPRSIYLFFLRNCVNRHEPPHQAFIGWDGFSWTSCLCWPQTVVLQIASCKITDMSHRARLCFFLLLYLELRGTLKDFRTTKMTVLSLPLFLSWAHLQETFAPGSDRGSLSKWGFALCG